MKNAVTLESLKAQGFKVFLKHTREDSGRYITRVAVYHEETHQISHAAAITHPNDQFSRKKGRTIALGRAMNERTRTLVDTEGWSQERLDEYIRQVVFS